MVFYYDFAFERTFTPEDLEAIEARMTELVKADHSIAREEWDRDEAVAFFRDMGERYKVQIIEELPADEEISIYQQGAWMDSLPWPPCAPVAKLKAFKLTKVAGAYWRGDSNNEMLQRVYGTAWANKKQLKQYLNRIEEAEKRDHRKIGKKLDLFHTQEEAPGMVFWHPAGWSIYQTIEQYMREAQQQNAYQEIKTPQLVDLSLWEKSGHADKFGDDMFMLKAEDREFAVKPMNCPCHVQVFNQGLKSYRDLAPALAEFGSCHRNEPSGSLARHYACPRLCAGRCPHFLYRRANPARSVFFYRFLALRSMRTFGFAGCDLSSVDSPGSGWVPTQDWDGPKRPGRRAECPGSALGEHCPGRALFTAPRSNFRSRTALVESGNWVPFRLISPCPAVWMRSTWRRMALVRCR